MRFAQANPSLAIWIKKFPRPEDMSTCANTLLIKLMVISLLAKTSSQLLMLRVIWCFKVPNYIPSSLSHA